MFNFEGRTKSAHHVSWRIHKGVFPSYLMHTCDNTLCVNPDHLVDTSHQKNVDDCVKKGRRARVDGPNNPNAILTEAEVAQIRASADPASFLATRFGVTVQTIYNVRGDRAWKTLNVPQA